VVEAREGDVPQVVVEQQVRPDLVAHHGQAVPVGELGQPQEVVAAEHRAGRVVRMAEPEELAGGRDGRGEHVPVDRPRLQRPGQRDADEAAAGEAGQREERRIDRREGEDLVVGPGQQAGGDRQPRDHPGHARHQVGFDLPAMQPFEVFDERRREARRGDRVAEHAVIDAPVDGVEDDVGRAEIHVGHPQGQDVATGPAVPLLRAGAVPIGAGGECGVALR
jgi:hypothetical protein